MLFSPSSGQQCMSVGGVRCILFGKHAFFFRPQQAKKNFKVLIPVAIGHLDDIFFQAAAGEKNFWGPFFSRARITQVLPSVCNRPLRGPYSRPIFPQEGSRFSRKKTNNRIYLKKKLKKFWRHFWPKVSPNLTKIGPVPFFYPSLQKL